MIRDLKAFYVAINENKVVCYETNLFKFLECFKKVENDIKSYQYYRGRFKDDSIIVYVNKERKVYFLQKVI